MLNVIYSCDSEAGFSAVITSSFKNHSYMPIIINVENRYAA